MYKKKGLPSRPTVLARNAGATTADAEDLAVIEVIASTVEAKGCAAHLGVTQSC